MTAPVQSPKPRRGCFFYGCIAGVLCLVVMLVAFLFAVQMFRKALNQFTDTQPVPLPRVGLSAAQTEELLRRVDTFQDAVSARRLTPPLELSADEINAFIASRPDFQGLTNKVYLSVEGDKVSAQLSVPMEEIGLSMFKGRYINGRATFGVSVENGLLRVTPDIITVKGKPLPDVYMQKLRSENLAASVNDNSKASIALNRLEKIDIKDGKVIFVPKVEK